MLTRINKKLYWRALYSILYFQKLKKELHFVSCFNKLLFNYGILATLGGQKIFEYITKFFITYAHSPETFRVQCFLLCGCCRLWWRPRQVSDFWTLSLISQFLKALSRFQNFLSHCLNVLNYFLNVLSHFLYVLWNFLKVLCNCQNVLSPFLNVLSHFLNNLNNL